MKKRRHLATIAIAALLFLLGGAAVALCAGVVGSWASAPSISPSPATSTTIAVTVRPALPSSELSSPVWTAGASLSGAAAISTNASGAGFAVPGRGLPDLPEGYHYRRVGGNVQVVRNPGRAVDLEPMHLEGGQLKFGPSPATPRSSATRAAFLRQMVDDPNWMRSYLKRGETPPGFAVHHRKALFDGGTGTIENMQLKALDLHNMRHRRYRPGGSHPSLNVPSTGSNY